MYIGAMSRTVAAKAAAIYNALLPEMAQRQGAAMATAARMIPPR